jgi:hypothetical protein
MGGEDEAVDDCRRLVMTGRASEDGEEGKEP